ncbi:MAG TPA: hypothetical protein VEI02_03840, partial [Planctomycetota bacterium]|nr:hypothetical protein [Planctomycetota bacterium]
CELSALGALAAALRRRLRPAAAAALLAAVAGLRADLRASTSDAFLMADGAVALGALLAIDGLARFGDDGDPAWRRLAVFGAAFAAWHKHEGAALCAAVGLAILLLHLRTRRAPGGARAPWLAFVALAAVPLTVGLLAAVVGARNDLVANAEAPPFWAAALARGVDRGLDVLRRLRDDVVFAPAAASLIFVAAPIAALLHPRAAAARGRLEGLVALAATAAVYAAAFAGTPHDLAWHWSTAGARVFGQLTPAAAAWTAATLGAGAPHLGARRGDG